MRSDPVTFALHTPGHLSFPSTLATADNFERAGARVKTSATGHLVFYRPDGRRFLATDPAGHPLHECEWELTAAGSVALARARIRLDCGRWVGVKPNGLVSETRLDLAAKAGWQNVTPDTLRAMAAQALRMPIEEVRWFFQDEDFSIDEGGTATIRHRKDALYALEGSGFEGAQFMSCMGAMHWDRIDFLPVVELFKSLLPGTGSAAFELIRGLYDDQNETLAASRVLRYRGVPPYPSEGAFRLFSSFFTPHVPGGGDPLVSFMDPVTAHQVGWRPAADPPVRYFDERQGLCLTVQGGIAQKATLAGDSAGAPFVNPSGRRIVPLDRSLFVRGSQVVLRDRTEETVIDTDVRLAVSPVSAAEVPISPLDWRSVYGATRPSVNPAEAFGAVLLYPEDDREIGELSAQPFVADYLQDLGELDRATATLLSEAQRVLIDNGDAVISSCIPFDRPRDYVISSRHAAYAQREAQQLWIRCAEMRLWERLRRVRFFAAASWEETIVACGPYDLVYQWLPYDSFDLPAALATSVARLRQVLRSGGSAFVVGPAGCGESLTKYGFRIVRQEPVETLPTFRMHKTILPKARVKAGLTLFQAVRV
jgi:hypothetical protein